MPWVDHSETLPPRGCSVSSQAAALFPRSVFTGLNTDGIREQVDSHSASLLLLKSMLFILIETHSPGTELIRSKGSAIEC